MTRKPDGFQAARGASMTIEHDEAMKLVQEQLKKAEAALSEAQRIADKHQVSFYWDGPTYGMGGHYNPKPLNEDGFVSSNCYEDYDESEGWNASSHSC